MTVSNPFANSQCWIVGRHAAVAICPVFMKLVLLLLWIQMSHAVHAEQTNSKHNRLSEFAEIQVVDQQTGHGIPLVELETVNGLRFVTDNAGRIAFSEPGLMGREIFFFVKSHGYQFPKDGFGYAGTRITPKAGEVAEIRMQRVNAAERLCRLTGEGRYRDSILLGHKIPLTESAHPGMTAGQDSVLAAIYRNKLYWFWGDTQQMKYPLGVFRTTGATTDDFSMSNPGFDPRPGIPYDYFVDDRTGFARAMIPISERPEGVVWISGLLTVPDESGIEKLVAHYSRRKGLVDEIEQGIAVFNDEKAIFEPRVQLSLTESWRRPNGHALRYEESGVSWILFCTPVPTVRVRARLEDVLDPQSYEAYSCAGPAAEEKTLQPELSVDGAPQWRWQKSLAPVDSKTEQQWIADGRIRPEHARFSPVNSEDAAERLVLHSGTVRWNAWRERWILIAGQAGGKPSHLGEVWYAEAKSPTGPFRKAARLITHDRMTFYNVCHHAFLDSDGGRILHFEGTYTNDFSGNPDRTPRYNYNQVLYRLDLQHPLLRDALID
jgi:hypothetical protein